MTSRTESRMPSGEEAKETSTNVAGVHSYSFCRAIKNFKAGDENEISLERGIVVEILDERETGTEGKRLKLDLGGETDGILDSTAAKHKISIRPKKKHADSRQKTFSSSESSRYFVQTIEDVPRRGWVPVEVLRPEPVDAKDALFDVRCKREAVVKELLETEEEFGKDLTYVVENYLKPSSEGACVPKIVKDNADIIFNNFRQITNFHNTTLLEGIKYYSDEPRMLGRTFLRLERDFDKHIIYCRDEPSAQEFLLDNPEAADFFEELSQKLADGKNLSEHLKLPVQRINDYQVLLKDLVKYSEKLGENSQDLKRALELMLAIPQRGNDNKFLSNIEGFHGNIHNLGRLLRHDWFGVTFDDGPPKERYLFLFREHVIICKVKKISEDRSVFILKDLISFSEVKIRDLSDGKTFEINGAGIKISARKENVKNCWLNEIEKHFPAVFQIEKEDKKTVQDVPGTVRERIENTTNLEDSSRVNVVDRSEIVSYESSSQKPAEEVEKTETMNRRLSTRRSQKSYEASYSASSQHEVYSHSSITSSRYASSSVYDSTTMSARSYESSAVAGSYSIGAGAATDAASAIEVSRRSTVVDSSEKPIFTRTISGLNLEPGETAVFECQLESEAKLTWLKDNKPLDDKLADRMSRSSSDDGTHRLELLHVMESDSGIYTAIARNEVSYSTCTAQLVVHKISDEEKKRREEANAPIFTVRLKDTELLKNTNFRFMVKVKGMPNPDVKFYKNGVPIRIGDDHVELVDDKADVGFYELVISDVRSTHAGLYSCKATNAFGEARCEGSITVTDDKNVFSGLETEILLTPGEKPSFSWIKDGKPFDPDERFKVLLGNEDDSLALIFQHVKPEDAGLYTCVASTTTGRISCSAELSVQGSVSPLAKEPKKPKISNESKVSEAQVGGSAMLEAKVLGFPKPDVKWYHEGEEIKASGRFKFLYEDEETMTLVIKNVNPRDGGCYKIVAKNELGEECTELSLIVKGAPKITKKMEDVSARSEEIIKISVGIEGAPTPDVKWYKDGKEIDESSERVKIIKESSETYSLIIENSRKTDSGTYSVVASNEVNQCTDKCRVEVRSAPEILKNMEKNIQLKEKEDIVFTVEVSSDSDTKIKWTKDGQELKSDGKKIKITEDGNVYTLRICDCDSSDSAEYAVEVSNEYGTTTDKGRADVKVETSAPVIKKGLKDVLAKEGDVDVELSVQVAAYPKPKIRWYLGETEITEKRNEYKKVEKDDNYKLVLKKVTTELKGTYTCKVENECGFAETTAKLIIQSKPEFQKRLESKVTVDEGAELTLQVECSGYPEPEVSWFKDGREIHTDAHIKITKDSHRSESYSMSLTLIKGTDGGEYEAKATNCLGSASTQTYVQVISKVTESAEEDIVNVSKVEKLEESQKAELSAEEEGDERAEPPMTKIHVAESDREGFKVEEIDDGNYPEDKSNGPFSSTGIVEEVLDGENVSERSHKLCVDRGVSIVSLSEDERTLSRNDSAVDLDGNGKTKMENDEDEEERERNALPENVETDKEENDFWASLSKAEETGEKGKISSDVETVKERGKTVEAPALNGFGGESRPDKPDDVFLNERNETNGTFRKPGSEAPDAPRSQTTEKTEKGTETPSRDAERESDVDEDPVVNALLSRIKKQRSVLEEILSKEAETHKEGTKQKPSFKSPLKDQICSESESCAFKCVLTANPQPEVIWYHDGKEVKVDGVKVKCETNVKETDVNVAEYTYTLKISEPATADSGLYLIKAQNKYGFDESSASLTLRIPEEDLKPKIKNLKDVTAIPESDATFEAGVRSGTSVTVVWLDKRDQKIGGDDERFVLTEDKVKGVYKLTVKNVKSESAGDFTIVATNDAGESRQTVKLFVQGEAPTIVKPVEDAEVKDGRDVNFLVRCNGIPKPEVKWFKDEKELDANERIAIKTQTEGQVSSFLSIEKFSLGDVGEYKVTAANSIGIAENKFNLKMSQTVPVFEKALPRSEEVDQGEVLELKCKLQGSPVPALKWLKDGEPLIPSDRVKMTRLPDGSVKLCIEDAKPEDSGTYSLAAENPNGQTTSNCVVAVQPKNCKPKVLEPMKDCKAAVGEPLRLEMNIAGFPAPEVKWFKDGRPVRPSQAALSLANDGGKIALTIGAVKPEDAGVYSVKISNKLGEISQDAKVEVIEPLEKPKIGIYMAPVSAVEGSPARFNVKASGNPKPAIKWYRKGKEIVPDGGRVLVEEGPDGTVSLILDRIVPEDAGEYAATAVNDKGEASCKAELNVLPKKVDEKKEEEPSFVRPLSNVALDEGNKLSLSGTIAGNPIPEVTWEKDGEPIKSSERISLSCDGSKVNLEIKCCKPSDSGSYVCHLRNPLGEARSKAIADVKKVFKEPFFVESFQDTEQLQNTDGKLEARISGNPKPEVEWFFNGEPVKQSDKYDIKNDGEKHCLRIRNCLPEDRGMYRCCASNRAGKADCVAQLKIVQKTEKNQNFEPPSFLKKISDCEIYKGMTAKFTACCAGFPDPEYEWYRGDEKLRPNSKSIMEREDNGLLRLTILGVDDDDVGAYRLRIFNPHGEAECSARLAFDVLDQRPKKAVPDRRERREKIESGAPSALSDKPIISRMTDRHLTLSWKPYIPSGPQLPVTYIVEMCKQPDGEWFTARRGIRSCACDIRNLEPFQDYKFRVRVENKYGISDPSPFAITYREKIIPDPPKFVPYLSSGIDFRPETSPYFPKDFDLDRPPHDRYEQAPKFLRQEHEVQYGIKNQNCNLFWFVYGYPKPTMKYYFNDEPIEMGGRYECSYTRNGQATLFVNSMLERDVGVYEAVASNEHGEARQRVRLEIAEHPVFVRRPEESYVMVHGAGQLTARIAGVPYPEIKWYKDWQPLAPTTRIKMEQIAPDAVVLSINDAIFKDAGLYSVSATNVAGAASSSAMIYVEEEEKAYRYATYSGGLNIKTKTEPLSNYYDIGDELGRGTQGITYHAVERRSGYNYAAKFMHGRSDLKTFMLNELNIMNNLNHRKLIRLHDSFETNDLLVLVMELAGGGELIEWLTRQDFIAESEIADYIRQILWGLEYMHSNGYAHLSLTLNDLLMSRPDGDDIKICDFGLSRRIVQGNLSALNYGTPEFVAPEVANGEGVSYPADMWALGVITYILLSGRSPFKGANDRETLTRIKEGRWKFEDDYFVGISAEAKDFIEKLLVYKSEDRMDVKTALKHPWLERAGCIRLQDQYKIKTDNLKNYYSSLKNWYGNANCRTWYRRRQPLSNAYTHPSKMVYPPGHDYTPEPEYVPVKSTRQTSGRPASDHAVPAYEPPDYEVGDFKSESHYQCGPDTYLLQLRDVDLPCRLRHYMKVAHDREQAYSSEPSDKHIDWRAPVIKERRKFGDIMDEEIDDERRSRIKKYGSDDVYSLRRLKREVGCRSDGRAEAEAMLEYKREGQVPFFREKPQNLAIIQNRPAELSCLVVGHPEPTVQWFKNDMVLAETSRIKMTTDENKRFYLKFETALPSDAGAYKVVAKNKVGLIVARMRVAVATVPLSPDAPEVVEVSDAEVLLKWKHQIDDVYTPILCYSLQYRQTGTENWMDVAKNIDHEFWLVKNLQPETSYEFRLSSKNGFGWSAPGIPSSEVKTKETGAPKIRFPEAQTQLQTQTENSGDVLRRDEKPKLDYTVEDSPLEWLVDGNLETKYQFSSEIFRGHFSFVVKGMDKTNNEQVVAKLFEVNADTEKSVAREFENIRSLRHERIVTLSCALRPGPNVAVFIMEKLQGADVLSYFASRREYDEDMIVTVLTQVLDGLQYLHWRGFCHLDLQPDNVVLSSVRALQVKLVDFGSARKVSKLGTVTDGGPCTEYSAPEILSNEAAYPQTDIWSLGTLTYVLLSGSSPFKADSPEETKQNIIFVRYRFEPLYKEITQEATRFLMQIFKRSPSKRPTVEECYETRWFLSSETMIKKRLKASFPGSRLRAYDEVYHANKVGKGLSLELLAKAFGEKVMKRSNSIQEELITF